MAVRQLHRSLVLATLPQHRPCTSSSSKSERYVRGCSGGEGRVAKNAICVHEEDAGIAWRHSDWRGSGSTVRRNRRLVVSSWFTVGNYDCKTPAT